ncbi:MAG TPA: hypothetical protein VN618_03595 [Solirubrobacteraceae bacterium]|nr:hypothetical protein [Solirubrobacteraceae bacterium]
MSPPPAASAAHAAPAAPLRRPTAPRRPRRVSGPARPAHRARPQAPPARRVATEGGGLVLSLLGALEALSSHRALDRLIRGRLWIGIVAFALIGIVALQLGLLKLNSGIGRALETQGVLQRENAALAIENSELASGGRVETEAQRLGMRLTGVSALKFHDSHARSDVPAAAAALKEAVKPAETHGEAEAPAAGSGESEASSSTGGAASEEEPTGGTSGESSSSSSSEGSTPSTTSETPEGTTAVSPPEASRETSAEAGGGTAAPGG